MGSTPACPGGRNEGCGPADPREGPGPGRGREKVGVKVEREVTGAEVRAILAIPGELVALPELPRGAEAKLVVKKEQHSRGRHRQQGRGRQRDPSTRRNTGPQAGAEEHHGGREQRGSGAEGKPEE